MIPILITLFVIIVDQISKYLISTNMKPSDSFTFIKNILNITYVTNKGAAFGILKDHRWIFMILSSVALVIMLVFMLYLIKRRKHLLLQISLAFLLGGGIGNMIDRFSLGYVVDFFEFGFIEFAVFNVADSFVSIGSVLFCICLFFKRDIFLSDDKNKKTVNKTDPDGDIEINKGTEEQKENLTENK